MGPQRGAHGRRGAVRRHLPSCLTSHVRTAGVATGDFSGYVFKQCFGSRLHCITKNISVRLKVKRFVRSPLLGSLTKDDGPQMRPARNGPKVLLQNFFPDWLKRTNHISKTLSDVDLATSSDGALVGVAESAIKL